jgi:hypothetical protein
VSQAKPMPLCTMHLGSAAFENLSCFQIVEPGARGCLISMRSFYDLHLLIRWARVVRPRSGSSPSDPQRGRSKDHGLLTPRIGHKLDLAIREGDHVQRLPD